MWNILAVKARHRASVARTGIDSQFQSKCSILTISSAVPPRAPPKFPYCLSIPALGFYEASVLHAAPFCTGRRIFLSRWGITKSWREFNLAKAHIDSKSNGLLLSGGRTVVLEEDPKEKPVQLVYQSVLRQLLVA
jgi:hypothetical protein